MLILYAFQWLIHEKDRLGSEEAFWDEYSDANGIHMRWQQIQDRLKARRMATDARDAAAARAYFGGNLARKDTHGVFRTGKGVYSKIACIAEKWRELLQDYPEIAARYQERGRDVPF